jgi:hypothetical protein
VFRAVYVVHFPASSRGPLASSDSRIDRDGDTLPVQSTLVKGPRWFRARTSDLYESRTINFHDVIRAVVRVVSSFE